MRWTGLGEGPETRRFRRHSWLAAHPVCVCPPRFLRRSSSYTVWIVTKAAPKLSRTEPAADDYRLLGRMPGYAVVKSENADASDLSFQIALNFVTAQGKRLHLDYEPKPGTQPAADLEIVENYLTAMKAKGGQLVYQNKT